MNVLIEKHYSLITCPCCQETQMLEVQEGLSQQFYRCPSCATLLKTDSGDCCIFCSYGSLTCSNPEQNLAS
ncbi:GDCCVxC domain-containing (seleno)protein [Polynucleobacter sp. TUM22923]|jgi:hypothetical protein|uniref:GDCCVxC domain-containing (seleno)protein n=1 Tax=Polynucleobacter sp. TUM22923 TaxID=3022126 RepID=UPI002573D53C|nr:GDCCVxC domain-containing (seleno)protein [Polynucleobacter sp. TUM22923]